MGCFSHCCACSVFKHVFRLLWTSVWTWTPSPIAGSWFALSSQCPDRGVFLCSSVAVDTRWSWSVQWRDLIKCFYVSVTQAGSVAVLRPSGGHAAPVHVWRGGGSLLNAQRRFQISCECVSHRLLAHYGLHRQHAEIDLVTMHHLVAFSTNSAHSNSAILEAGCVKMHQSECLCVSYRSERRTKSTSRPRIRRWGSSGSWPSSRCFPKRTRCTVSRWARWSDDTYSVYSLGSASLLRWTM